MHCSHRRVQEQPWKLQKQRRKDKTGITELHAASIFSVVERITMKLILNTLNGNIKTVSVGIRIRISGGFI
jgi:hypothetical protein